MKRLAMILAVLVSIYLFLLAIVFVFQRNFLYFPSNVYLSPNAVGTPMEEIKSDSGEIISWWSPPKSDVKKVIMVFHGNGSAIYSNYDIFNDLIAEGHGVLSVGYPGYPGRTGKPSQSAIVDSAVAQYDWILAQGITPDRIAFYGTSLGSGVAAQLSVTREPVMLFADAPFNSILDMGKRTMRFLPVELLMKDRFRSDLALSGKNFPLIWTHGTADNIVPLSQGQKLFDGYSGPKSAHVIEGGDHINLWAKGGREITLNALSN
jgi:fermentation-respiration switch protein FrsA (DUF1100 family)